MWSILLGSTAAEILPTQNPPFQCLLRIPYIVSPVALVAHFSEMNRTVIKKKKKNLPPLEVYSNWWKKKGILCLNVELISKFACFIWLIQFRVRWKARIFIFFPQPLWSAASFSSTRRAVSILHHQRQTNWVVPSQDELLIHTQIINISVQWAKSQTLWHQSPLMSRTNEEWWIHHSTMAALSVCVLFYFVPQHPALHFLTFLSLSFLCASPFFINLISFTWWLFTCLTHSGQSVLPARVASSLLSWLFTLPVRQSHLCFSFVWWTLLLTLCFVCWLRPAPGSDRLQASKTVSQNVFFFSPLLMI